jgi:hypothetical protein
LGVYYTYFPLVMGKYAPFFIVNLGVDSEEKQTKMQ